MRGTALAVLASGALLGGCAAGPAEPPPSAPPTVLHESERVRITRLQSGWVAVKRRFREYGGPSALRFAAIVLDRHWTEWMPITFYLVEHGERRIVFDTGESARASDPEWFACDGATRWFYTRQLRFRVAPEDELGPQLEHLGIDPASVDTVVLSHLHSDHVGGLRHVAEATWLLSARDADGHPGALLCRIPEHADTRRVRPAADPFGAFAESHRVSDDGDVRIVPTPGHTAGHQSLLVRDGERWTLLAGDLAFDRGRLGRERALPGIVDVADDARHTLETVREQLERFDTLFVAAHDAATHAH